MAVPRLKAFALLALAVAVALSAGVLAQPRPDPAAADRQALAGDRVRAAKKAYELLFEPSRQGTGAYPPAESIYIWSRRWLEAEADAAETAKDRASAYRAHAERMRALDERYRGLPNAAAVSAQQRAAVETFVAEARFLVARCSSE